MKRSNVTVRLEAHRLKWVRDGKRIPLLPFHELSDQERQFFIDELTKDATVRRLNVNEPAHEHEFDRMMLNILNDWGVMCPHPRASVEQMNNGFYCNTCGCYIPIRRKFKDAKVGV